MRAEYRPRAAALGADGDPWPLFVEMLGKLHDPHVHLSDGPRRFQARRGETGVITPVQESLATYLGKPDGPLAGGVTLAAHDRLAYGVTGDKVGYLAIMTMGGFAKGPVGWPGNTTVTEDARAAAKALTTALASLNGTRGLILDLRFNPGGSDVFSEMVASCFADRKRLAYVKSAKDGAGSGPAFETFIAPGACPRYGGPVVVLTGERTTSAAESLLMRLRVLPGVSVMGQPTQGAHSDVLDKTLPNGWKLGLSNEIYRLADGKIYEGVGIPPDVATPAVPSTAPDDLRFGRDIRAAAKALSRSGSGS